MILRDCDTCYNRTVHIREQWAEADGDVTIRTEYTCKRCGTVDTKIETFSTDERSRTTRAGPTDRPSDQGR
jgi:hypothetical protein